FTDAVLGEVAATTLLDVLEVVSVAVSPANLSFPAGSTEPLVATATLEGGAQTTRIPFNWWTSDETIATVVAGSVLGTANVAGQDLGAATITAFTSSGPVVTGTMQASAIPPLRNQELFDLDRKSAGNRIISIDTTGNTQFVATMLAPYDDRFCSSSSHVATMLAPYDDRFCSSSSHDANEILVGGFELSTGFSEIQRIDSVGNVTDVYTSTTVTQIGDTIDVQAIRYRPDGQAYFAMSEGQHAFTRVDQSGGLFPIGGPNGNDGFGPIAIAPFGNDLAYSGSWGVELLGQGNKVQGFAELVARYSSASPTSNEFIAKTGVSLPRLVAPDGDLWVLDGGTGALFRFEDVNGDGDHYFILTESVAGQIVQSAVDDPGERISAGQLPVGFNQLQLDSVTGDIIATRVVGTAPQRITVMRVADLNSDGDVDDAGEQEIVFDAGAPPGTDAADALLKY
ncbi:MAG: Ig-like domain-containing protein, partial [Deltaproteobacteria bacterium]|nr:Ig-like domain-containing protein [Deltaproteobacteria bacterium]